MFKITKINEIKKDQLNDIKLTDEIAVNDVILTLENESKLYNQLKNFKTNTLDKKIKNDSFVYGYGLKGIKNIIDSGIKEFYIIPFCYENVTVKNLLTTNERVYIYSYFLDKWLQKEFN